MLDGSGLSYDSKQAIFNSKSVGASYTDAMKKSPDQTQSFDSEATASAANLPKGTIIMINGRRAQVN